MRIIMLGTGAALPDPDRCHTAILLTLGNGRHFLLDCGHGATRQMVRVNVNPADVAHLFLTHLHHDHVCELPFFVISSRVMPSHGAVSPLKVTILPSASMRRPKHGETSGGM